MSYDNETGFYHNLLLVIYDNNGYKVWSKRYRGKYSFEDKLKDRTEKYYQEKLIHIYYEIIQSLLNDYKEEINADLDLIIGNVKD
jgi:hypothetical protein